MCRYVRYTGLGQHHWLMIAFIIWNSNLVPLPEGLCSSNSRRFESSVFRGFAGSVHVCEYTLCRVCTCMRSLVISAGGQGQGGSSSLCTAFTCGWYEGSFLTGGDVHGPGYPAPLWTDIWHCAQPWRRLLSFNLRFDLFFLIIFFPSFFLVGVKCVSGWDGCDMEEL